MPWGMSETEWQDAVREVREILVDVARRRDVINYTELTKRVTSYPLRPDGHDFHAVLGRVSLDEHEEGRPLLTALVVYKSGEMSAGSGFFEMAQTAGFTFNDPDVFWLAELNRVWDYWRTR